MALNNGCIYESQILPGEAGRTLLAHLAATYRHSDCDTWRARLASGEVALDDRPAAGDERLRAGQRLVWARPAWDEPEVPLAFSVLHIDAALLVVDKPAGLPTLPAGGFLEHTLWALIRTQHPEASPVHRLGRFTSGLVLFARSHDAGASLSRAWRNHRVTKDYRALGAGRPAWTMREVTAPIGPVPHRRLGTVFGASEAGKPARSVLVARPGSGPDTVFDVRIVTGRPHQIRIHLAHAGHPLVGDPLYGLGGVPRAEATALPGDGGYRLHAHRVVLAHPFTGESLRLEAPPPPDLV
jgi:23S rRNA pseudouridine1911/1915/1917 synthase